MSDLDPRMFRPPVGCLHPMHDDDCACGSGPVDGIIRAQPCSNCSKPTLSLLEFSVSGDAAMSLDVPSDTVVLARFICRPCQGPEREEADRRRAIFEGYLAEGMSRESANRAMIAWHGPGRRA
jgi:hypothetical protein